MADNNTNKGAEGPAGSEGAITLNQPKLTLATNEDDDDGSDEEFPKAVINRLVGLKQIQENYDSLEIKYKAERILLEQKYFELRKPLQEQRANVVSGAVDVEIEAEEREDATPDEGAAVKGIPNFWLQCMVNHPLLGQLVEDGDHEALASLLDIRVEYNETYSSFKVIFTFGENEFFTNTELVKTYEVTPDLLDDKAPALTNVDGTEIDWKPKKNLCTEEIRKKAKAGAGNKGGKKGGQVKYVTEMAAKASFFHFFADPHMEDEDDEDEEDVPPSAGGRKHEHQLSVDADYEIGHALRAEIVPNAVGWFTGEADEGDDDDEGLILDDEDEEEEDEDDPDEESEEVGGGGRPAGGPKKKGGAAGGGAAAGGAEQPECKQS